MSWHVEGIKKIDMPVIVMDYLNIDQVSLQINVGSVFPIYTLYSYYLLDEKKTELIIMFIIHFYLCYSVTLKLFYNNEPDKTNITFLL